MIRPAKPVDLAAIDQFDEFSGARQSEIAEDRMLVFEAESAAKAYISWHPSGFVGNPFITYLCIAPSHRRKGIANALIKQARAALPPERVFISTEEDNTAMLSLLKKQGWTMAGQVNGANSGEIAEVFFYAD